jgi:hypothetical protein
MTGTVLEDTVMGEGCRVVGSRIKGCVIGPCSFIDSGCDLQVGGRRGHGRARHAGGVEVGCAPAVV